MTSWVPCPFFGGPTALSRTPSNQLFLFLLFLFVVVTIVQDRVGDTIPTSRVSDPSCMLLLWWRLVKGFLWTKTTQPCFSGLSQEPIKDWIFLDSFAPRSPMKTKFDCAYTDSHATRWIEDPQCLEWCVSSFLNKMLCCGYLAWAR